MLYKKCMEKVRNEFGYNQQFKLLLSFTLLKKKEENNTHISKEPLAVTLWLFVEVQRSGFWKSVIGRYHCRSDHIVLIVIYSLLIEMEINTVPFLVKHNWLRVDFNIFWFKCNFWMLYNSNKSVYSPALFPIVWIT